MRDQKNYMASLDMDAGFYFKMMYNDPNKFQLFDTSKKYAYFFHQESALYMLFEGGALNTHFKKCLSILHQKSTHRKNCVM